MKPIPGYPGYYLTENGTVMSSRKTKNGSLKPLKTRSNGQVFLCRSPNDKKSASVAVLMKQIYGKQR